MAEGGELHGGIGQQRMPDVTTSAELVGVVHAQVVIRGQDATGEDPREEQQGRKDHEDWQEPPHALCDSSIMTSPPGRPPKTD